ncbi:alpha-2-macroglobulin receptor-associated protein-like [Glandiceps talaboti]
MLVCLRILLTVFLMVLCFSEMQSLPPGGKYSEDVQNTFGPGGHPSQWEFRHRRVNQVWEKAQRMGFPADKLANLKKELKRHDERAMQWKKMKRDGGDPDGEKEAGLRRQLSDIMNKYGMGKVKLADDKMTMEARVKDARDPRQFDDLRLNRLWMQASQSGKYSEQELQDLRKELSHHQEKVVEYRQLVDDVQGTHDINRIDKFRRLDVDEANAAKDRKVKELELKVKHKMLNDDYKKLEMKTLPEEERSGFTEPRVHQLWKDATKANFTDDELDSIKEELKHFEKKIQKHEDLKQEAILEEIKYHSAKAAGEQHDSKHHQSLKERTRDMAHKVKKYMTDFTDRIAGRRQTEL